jgi:hypothetical protein
VVSLSVLIDVLPEHFLAGKRGDAVESLQDRSAIVSAAADVVYLAAARVLVKCVNESRHI